MTKEEIDAYVATLPIFAFVGDSTEVVRGASHAFPDGEDHEVDLAIRTARALQAMYGDRLDEGDQISPEDVETAMSSVAYVPLTESARVNALYVLTYSWRYWAQLP